MATRREIVEAILFLPAMALLAVAVFAGMYVVIRVGGWVLQAIYGVLRYELHLPHPAALAVSVLLAAAVVATVVPRLISWIGSRLNR